MLQKTSFRIFKIFFYRNFFILNFHQNRTKLKFLKFECHFRKVFILINIKQTCSSEIVPQFRAAGRLAPHLRKFQNYCSYSFANNGHIQITNILLQSNNKKPGRSEPHTTEESCF